MENLHSCMITFTYRFIYICLKCNMDSYNGGAQIFVYQALGNKICKKWLFFGRVMIGHVEFGFSHLFKLSDLKNYCTKYYFIFEQIVEKDEYKLLLAILDPPT